MSGKYLLLSGYLQNRYADTVVLTFGQIESLLGFSLPDQARLSQQLKGPGFSVRYEGESAAVVTARRANSLGLRPLRAR
jgi:hypothetical protein